MGLNIPEKVLITVDLIGEHLRKVFDAENLPDLSDRLVEVSALLGFDHVSLSCNKRDRFELSGYPDVSNWTGSFQSDYRRGSWHKVDQNLERALVQPEALWWEVDPKAADKESAPFMEFLHSYKVRTGILLALPSRPGFLSGVVVCSEHVVACSPDVLQLVSIVGRAALLKIETLGLCEQLSADQALATRQLSAKHRDILRWSAEGKSNQDIATILGMSKRAVDYHMSQIFKQLGVSSKAQAVAIVANSRALFNA